MRQLLAGWYNVFNGEGTEAPRTLHTMTYRPLPPRFSLVTYFCNNPGSL